jgi:Carboxypeptidase regulatory-like domain
MGSVVNDQGIPQMAAEVQLFDHLGTLARRAFSSMDGRFAFPNLPADSYSAQVSLADYLPARLDSIVVKAGMNSILDIHLTTILSSIQLTYAVPTGGMSKDWKWVLRSSPATRPINRLQPEDVSVSQDPEQRARVFSGTHAVVSVSGGDNSLIDTNPQNDIGTGFFLSTNILQKNQLQIGGSVAQSSAFLPAAMGLSAIYSRNGDGPAPSLTPEVTFTISQLGLFAGSGLSSSGQAGSQVPAVRTMSLSTYQVVDVGGLTRVEYGVTGETVDYLGYTTRVSPFARASTPLGKFGKVIASYSDGARPDELLAHQERTEYSNSEENAGTQLTDAVNSLSHIPQLSYHNGRLELERTQSFEVGYRKAVKNRSYAVSAFAEDVSNGRVDVSGNTSLLNSGNLLSDGSSGTSVYNIGRYKRTGVIASVNQQIRSSFELSLAYGRMGGLSTSDGTGMWSQDGKLDEGFLEERSQNVANAAVNLRAPKTFTRISANYGWTDGNAVIPTHVFTTQNTWMSPGLNVLVRQPLPSLFGMPGHLELNADLRNLLAQGYLPVNNGAGRSLLVVQTPRAIRGGLNFIF